MEISLFPSLYQEDFSNFYCTTFQHIENTYIGNIPRKKRPRTDTLSKELMSIFSFFDEDSNSVHESWDFGQQSSSVLDFNHQANEVPKPLSERTVEIERERPWKTSLNADGLSEDKNGGGQQRRLWVKDRSQAWWAYHNSNACSDEEFRKAFRMSKGTFDMICDELESTVTKKDTTLRTAIPVRQRVAVCIFRLATGEPLRYVSQLFGLGISTCHKLVLDVCAAINSVLMPKFLQWQDSDKSIQRPPS